MRHKFRWILGGLAMAGGVAALCKSSPGTTLSTTSPDTPSEVTPSAGRRVSSAPKAVLRGASTAAAPRALTPTPAPPALAPERGAAHLRERARQEQATLADQDVNAAAVAFQHQEPALDHATRRQAEALVVHYATDRMELLNEMYEAYLSVGEAYDPRSNLADLRDLSEKFRQEAQTLEERVPGVSRLATMLDSTSLRVPTFVPALLENDG